MRIPRPDLDALIWLTGCEQEVNGQRLHAVRGAEVYCGHSEPLDVRELLWIDRAELASTLDAVECPACSQLDHRQSGTRPDELVAIYSARQGKKDSALIRHVVALAPAFSADHDYRIDTARTQFDDGFGCTTTIWRRITPSVVDKSEVQRRRLP